MNILYLFSKGQKEQMQMCSAAKGGRGKEARPVEIIGQTSSMETADHYTKIMTSEGKANF